MELIPNGSCHGDIRMEEGCVVEVLDVCSVHAEVVRDPSGRKVVDDVGDEAICRSRAPVCSLSVGCHIHPLGFPT